MNGTPTEDVIIRAYELARERYAEFGVSTDEALDRLLQIPISLHCWQGDDVLGFENPDQALSGGIMATGNYPGKARTADEFPLAGALGDIGAHWQGREVVAW